MRLNEADTYQENPQLANWTRLAQNREIFDGSVDTELGYERVSANKARDPKTGKVAISFGGGPFVRISPTFHYTSAEGKTLTVSKSTLFTWTSKMSCPSFSIPAGPVEYGGTCIASKAKSIEKEGTYEEFHPPLSDMPAGQKFICDLCYAGKGRYLMYKLMSIGQVVKLHWVQRTVREGTFARRMTEAISSLLDPETEELLLAKLVSNKFFRIHDSGDFYSKDYYKAWVEVCYNLPQVKFWAPTRLWVYQDWRRVFENYPPPANLALRPSALFTSAPPSSGSGDVIGIHVRIWPHGLSRLELPGLRRRRRKIVRGGGMQGLLDGAKEAGQLPDPLEMNARLKAIVDRVRHVQANPPDGELVDGGTLLQIELGRENVDFSEDELIEALKEIGVKEQDIPAWFEEFGGWV